MAGKGAGKEDGKEVESEDESEIAGPAAEQAIATQTIKSFRHMVDLRRW
jgi:hypothetical protein